MMRIVTWFYVALTLIGSAWAVVPGQVETFSGPTNLWSSGVLVPSGGPDGAGDQYVLISRNIEPGPLGISNRDQWQGDYSPITALRGDFANFGPTPIELRMTITSGAASYTSLSAVVLPPDSIWRTLEFSLDSSSVFWQGFGTDNYSLVRRQASNVGFGHHPGPPPALQVEVIGALGVDNITAVPEPGMLGLVGVAALLGCGRGRRVGM